MKRVLLLAAMVACKTSEGDDFPVEPGGPGPGPVGMIIDAAVVDAPDFDAVSLIVGRVCLVSDLRALTACAGTGAGGITVSLGTQTATTVADGSFTIVKPSGSNLVWRATGANIVTSVLAFGPSTSIPAIGVEDYQDLQNANSVTVIGGEGSIVARIVRNGIPQSGVTVTVSPIPAFPPKYDGPAVLTWNELATSTAGTVWIAGTALGTNAVTAKLGTTSIATENVLVLDQAITYATIDLP